MSKTRRHKRPKGPKQPPIPKDPSKGRWSKGWRVTAGIGGYVVATIGLVAGVVAFLPRLQIDFSEITDPLSPFPSSITITNGLIPLTNASVFVRPCRILTPDGKGNFVGPPTCDGSNGSGGITMPEWQHHYLAMDEKWTIPMGGNVPFQFETGAADILVVVTYWPSLLPRFLRETPARFVIHKQPDGRLIWIRRPVD